MAVCLSQVLYFKHFFLGFNSGRKFDSKRNNKKVKYCRNDILSIYIYIYKYQIVKKVLSLHSRKCFSKHVHISDISRNLSHFQVCNFHQLYIYWYFISAMFVLLLFFYKKNVLGSDKDMYCFISFS